MRVGSPQTFGPYILYEQLGKGGMASVHLADRRNSDGSKVRVALKRLLPRAEAQPELVESFLREARLLQYLNHPNIAGTYEFGQVGSTHYIAMEYVPGPTLKRLVQHCGKTVGPIPIAITLDIAAQICDGLDHAHTCRDEHDRPLGIVHRDISPANIIFSDNDGLVKLIDFGLAKAKVSTTITGEGVIKGKFNYVAPEYLGGKLDARADLWAVGVVMYELLTSRRLFDAPDDFETMTRVRKLPIPRPSRANPKVSKELDKIVMTALERDPAKRWQTAAQLRDALRALIESGKFVERKHTIAWVRWAFQQKPGSKMTSESKLASMINPPQPPPIPTAPMTAETTLPTSVADESVKRSGAVWIVLALIMVLASAFAVWKLAS